MRLRAFHKGTKELCNVFQLIAPDGSEQMIVGWNGKKYIMDWGNWIIIRPVGINDVKGIPIYDTDILRGNNGAAFAGIVKWMDSECAFFIEIGGNLSRLTEAFIKQNGCVVAGNSLLPPPAPREEAPQPTQEVPAKKSKKSSPSKNGKSNKA